MSVSESSDTLNYFIEEIMFITIYRLNFTHLFVTLAVKIAVGAVVYIAILVILREETIQEVFVKIISKRRT